MLYPLKFEPILKYRIWGGTRLKKLYGKSISTEDKIGESWELSGVENNESVISNGFLAGNTLTEAIEIYMDELVGKSVFDTYGTHFPLLFKLIDANDRLSIQVHPSDELAADKHNSFGKTEMWYILDTEPDAELILGLNKEMDAVSLKESIQNNTLEEYLQRIPIKKGDAFFIPAGFVHAIGKGVLIAEIQQTSDITYRLYDYNRLESNSKPRELHVEDALGAIDYSNQKAAAITYACEDNIPVCLVECEYFTTRLIHLTKSIEMDYSNMDSFVVYMCIEGSFEIKYESESLLIEKGETVLIPAVIREFQIELIENNIPLVKLLEITIS